jgi:magnesium-protoporphyrin IX monomethyl ester (oxidative) cyclase
LENGHCDYCIVGEGEISFREFVRAFSDQQSLYDVEGVAGIKDGEVVFTSRKVLEDMDQFPFPAYGLIDPDDYLKSPYLYKSRSAIGEQSISMITSRGCPFDCVFCSIKLHMAKRYRFHSPDYVIKHLKYCINELGINHFHFEDDNISLNKKRFEKILDRIIDEKLTIKWDTPNGIRADTLNYNILEKIKKSGCTSLQLAIESGNQRVLNEVIKKSSDLQKVLEVVKFCSQLEIRLAAFFVIGFPGEQLSEMEETIGLAIRLFKEYNVLPILLFATPLYGTDLYNNALKEGLIEEHFTDKDIATATQFYGNPIIETKDFSKQDLKNISESFEKRMDQLVENVTFRKILQDRHKIFKETDTASNTPE